MIYIKYLVNFDSLRNINYDSSCTKYLQSIVELIIFKSQYFSYYLEGHVNFFLHLNLCKVQSVIYEILVWQISAIFLTAKNKIDVKTQMSYNHPNPNPNHTC